MNISDPANMKNQFNTIRIIYFSLISGLVLFFAVTLIIMNERDVVQESNLDSIFIILVPLFGLIMMFLSRLIYNKRIVNLGSGIDLSQKIEYYRTTKLISWALVEGGCLLALVASIITTNYLYIIVFILLLGFFIMVRPSVESCVQDMQLSSKERNLISGN